MDQPLSGLRGKYNRRHDGTKRIAELLRNRRLFGWRPDWIAGGWLWARSAPHCRKGESPARNLSRAVLSTAEAYLIHWNAGYNQGAEAKNDGFAAKQNVVCRRDFGGGVEAQARVSTCR